MAPGGQQQADPVLIALLDRVIQVQGGNQRYFDNRAVTDREARFRIRRDIPKISAENGDKLLLEFDEFEEVFARTDPRHAKDWAMTLDEALTGRAKVLRDHEILNPPGRDIYEATVPPNAPDEAYAQY